MELKQAMNQRKSIRSYTGEPVSQEQLDAILNAAYEAPIGMGRYDSIHLTVITNKDLLAQIDANAAQAFGNPKMHPLYGAPMLIVLSALDEVVTSVANVGITLQNMSLQAVELGLGQCLIYGAIRALNANPELVAKLGLPKGFKPRGSLVLGPTTEVYADRDVPQKHHFAMDVLD